jgi:hypothetical protein
LIFSVKTFLSSHHCLPRKKLFAPKKLCAKINMYLIHHPQTPFFTIRYYKYIAMMMMIGMVIICWREESLFWCVYIFISLSKLDFNFIIFIIIMQHLQVFFFDYFNRFLYFFGLFSWLFFSRNIPFCVCCRYFGFQNGLEGFRREINKSKRI